MVIIVNKQKWEIMLVDNGTLDTQIHVVQLSTGQNNTETFSQDYVKRRPSGEIYLAELKRLGKETIDSIIEEQEDYYE